MSDLLIPPEDPAIHAALAALAPLDREAAAALAASVIGSGTPLYQGEAGRRIAWKHAVEQARLLRRDGGRVPGAPEQTPVAHELTVVTPEQITVLTHQDLVALQLPDTKWRIPGLLPDGVLAMLSGWSGTWKSWALHDMAVAVATGGRFLDAYPCERGRVLFIQAEEGIREHRRKASWIANNSANGADPEYRALDIHSVVQPLLLSDPKRLALVVPIIADLKPALVLTDSLRQTFVGDENDSEFATALKRTHSKIQAVHECAMVFVHHARKIAREASLNEPGQRMRGSGALRAALDQHYVIERDKAGFGTFVHEKSREGLELPACNFRFHGGEGFAWFESLGPAVDPTVRTGAPRAIVDALRAAPDRTRYRSDLVQVLAPQFTEDQIGRALSSLMKKKRVTKGERDGTGMPYTLLELLPEGGDGR